MDQHPPGQCFYPKGSNHKYEKATYLLILATGTPWFKASLQIWDPTKPLPPNTSNFKNTQKIYIHNFYISKGIYIHRNQQQNPNNGTIVEYLLCWGLRWGHIYSPSFLNFKGLINLIRVRREISPVNWHSKCTSR